MKRIFTIISIIALFFCSCSKEESIKIEENNPKVYHFSIKATTNPNTKGVTFDGDGVRITTQFESADKIYVYNETKGAFARFNAGEHLLSYLQPTSISGTSCALEGDLTFWKLNGSDEWESVEVEAGDSYSLFYKMNDPDYKYTPSVPIPRFDWSNQNGSATSASSCDFAEAKGVILTLSGTTLTVPTNVRFENLQSMFRQRLSFIKGGSPVTPTTITKLTVGTKNETYLMYYRPDRPDLIGGNGKYWAFDSFDIDNPVITGDGDIYLSLAFYYTPSTPAAGDQLILTATDSEGNIYQCSKEVPSGGFQKSKYYHGSCEMVWQYKYTIGMPIVTCFGSTSVILGEYYDEMFDFYSTSADIEATISGNSNGYRFFLNSKPATVTLTGSGNPVSAIWSGDNSAFIESEDNLTIILDCNYVIDNSAYEKAIECAGNLKLATTGGTHTLTVITNDDGSFAYGIYGDSNYDAWYYTFVFPDDNPLTTLAATGFTVSCPGPVDNGDGTYTWVYTVSPTP